MRISEIIRRQDDFQEPRGLNEVNKGEVVFDRFMEEVYEAERDVVLGNDMAALVEISDVFIMAGAVALWLTKELELKPEDVDNIVAWKMNQNEKKYPTPLFNHFSPKIAMDIARELWDREHPQSPYPRHSDEWGIGES
jgi:hypothetical protein